MSSFRKPSRIEFNICSTILKPNCMSSIRIAEVRRVIQRTLNKARTSLSRPVGPTNTQQEGIILPSKDTLGTRSYSSTLRVHDFKSASLSTVRCLKKLQPKTKHNGRGAISNCVAFFFSLDEFSGCQSDVNRHRQDERIVFFEQK